MYGFRYRLGLGFVIRGIKRRGVKSRTPFPLLEYLLFSKLTICVL